MQIVENQVAGRYCLINVGGVCSAEESEGVMQQSDSRKRVAAGGRFGHNGSDQKWKIAPAVGWRTVARSAHHAQTASRDTDACRLGTEQVWQDMHGTGWGGARQQRGGRTERQAPSSQPDVLARVASRGKVAPSTPLGYAGTWVSWMATSSQGASLPIQGWVTCT